MRTITFRIQRYDGSRSWFQEYVIPYESGRTVLWALIKIREEQDPTLTFTAACRHAICGSCAVRVNGHSVLACKTSLDELLKVFQTDVLEVTPLSNFPVIRDLVVDWRPKTERLKTVKPWLIPTQAGSAATGFAQSPQEYRRIASPTDCIQCGICSSECEQLAENPRFLDPFILNRAYRFAVDSRDAAPEEHIRPALESDLWKCLHCYQCVTHCPKEIRLDQEIAYLRQQTIRMGETDNPGARHALAFHDDVRNTGRLDEVTLPIKTEGLLRTVTRRLPFAMRLIRTGKVNPLQRPRPVRGIEGIRKIYAHVKEKEGKRQ
ncbi:MAG: succinate dehydrogenase/fumarate reductase iron-sulfur subunit [Firmicutes bacterium]|nr:succinate dehydrogenase/fumarate reductase iron-sulfur subunit [Bacillota bacterium]